MNSNHNAKSAQSSKAANDTKELAALVDGDTERAALGQAIVDQSGYCARELVRLFTAEHFGLSDHRAIFEAIKEVTQSDELPLDYCSVLAELRKHGSTITALYVSSLGEGAVIGARMDVKAKRLRDLAQRRHFLQLVPELETRAHDLTIAVSETAHWLEGEAKF